ncbi:MAG: imidazolonepropionase [Deltaproteobacteria bacterium]|nr:imidazolonepropionase [Deltaproteobacteria bacterium]
MRYTARMKIKADLVVKNASQVFTSAGSPESPVVVEGGSVAVAGGLVAWVGKTERLADDVEVGPEAMVIDAAGGVVTPGFVDPHTHAVFAGSRPLEFEWRLSGRSYLDILADGGGILATVNAVRQADEDQLVRESLPRLDRMLEFGVTTCEVKSGYGLDVENELKLLRVARKLASLTPMRILPTFLGAHTFPPEFRDDHDKYVKLVIEEMLPAVVEEGLALACDVYVEKGVFDVDQAEQILRAATDSGLGIHVHAGQFVDLGGPEMAAGMGASSVDHLDVVSDEGLAAMARSGTVAVMLPGAAVSLGQKPPRVDRFLEAGVTLALATDLNPGTSYTENLPLMAFLSVTSMGLPCSAALLAITRHAAKAVGLKEPEGTLAPGARADLLIHDVSDWREILYHFGVTHVSKVLIKGKPVAGPRAS